MGNGIGKARQSRPEQIQNNESRTSELIIESISHEGQVAMELLEDKSRDEQLNIERTGLDVITQITSTTENLVQSSEYFFEGKVTELKERLLRFTNREHGSLPLAPLFEGNDSSLLKFYALPTIRNAHLLNDNDRAKLKSNAKVENRNKKHDLGSVTDLVDTFEKLFVFKVNVQYTREAFRKNGNNIFLVADAGHGKTSFAKFVALVWCLLNLDRDYINILFRDRFHKLSNPEYLLRFDFVFLLLLRDFSGKLCSVEDMVVSHVQCCLGYRYNDEDFIRAFLNRQHCLVILDGLDEWTHPSGCEEPEGDGSLPHLPLWNNCTFMITSRPYKLATSKIRNSTIDIQLTIDGLNSFSSNELVFSLTECLNVRFRKDKDANEFIRLTKQETIRAIISSDRKDCYSNNSCNDWFSVPIILMHLLCLWHDDRKWGDSKCSVYIEIISLLFKRASEKITNTLLVEEDVTETNHIGFIPLRITENQMCMKFLDAIITIGRFAFATYFFEGEDALVYSEELVVKHLSKYYDLCLATGLLTQSTVSYSASSGQFKVFSFLHKSFYDLFSAIYISTRDINSNEYADILSKIAGKSKSNQGIESNLFRFICGLNSRCAAGISITLGNREVKHTVERALLHRYMHMPENMISLQKLINSGSVECTELDKSVRNLPTFITTTIEVCLQIHEYSWLQMVVLEHTSIKGNILLENTRLSCITLEHVGIAGKLNVFKNEALVYLYLSDAIADDGVYINNNRHLKHLTIRRAENIASLENLDSIGTLEIDMFLNPQNRCLLPFDVINELWTCTYLQRLELQGIFSLTNIVLEKLQFLQHVFINECNLHTFLVRSCPGLSKIEVKSVNRFSSHLDLEDSYDVYNIHVENTDCKFLRFNNSDKKNQKIYSMWVNVDFVTVFELPKANESSIYIEDCSITLTDSFSLRILGKHDFVRLRDFCANAEDIELSLKEDCNTLVRNAGVKTIPLTKMCFPKDNGNEDKVGGVTSRDIQPGSRLKVRNPLDESRLENVLTEVKPVRVMKCNITSEASTNILTYIYSRRLCQSTDARIWEEHLRNILNESAEFIYVVVEESQSTGIIKGLTLTVSKTPLYW